MYLVFYDAGCPVCVGCKAWLEGSAQHVPLALLDCRGLVARTRYAQLPWLGRELVVVGERGEVWVGPRAFLVCLWALRTWRPLATLLATEPFWALGEVLFRFVSDHRGAFGALVGAPPCHDGHSCAAHPAGATSGPFR